MSLFDGCGQIVDRHLGIDDSWKGRVPRYMHPTSLQKITTKNLPIGEALVSELFGQMMRNWGSAGCPATRSKQNWRFTKHLDFQDVERSPEVPLERTISSLMGSDWANQIPVDSGLMRTGGKTLDLACLNDGRAELIELKVKSNTPLSAAIQILLYGLANVFFQINKQRVLPTGSASELLEVKELRLRVLAPVTYYERFAKVELWLKSFESCLDEGVKIFSERLMNPDYSRITQFSFQVFPAWFTWDQSLHADENHRHEVLEAVNARAEYFGLSKQSGQPVISTPIK